MDDAPVWAPGAEDAIDEVARRTVMAAAWASPVLAMTVATPLAAASTTPSDSIELTPTVVNLLGSATSGATGLVSTRNGGTLPPFVTLSLARTTGSGTVTVDPAQPPVSGTGEFAFRFTGTVGSALTRYVITATPLHAEGIEFVPGGNTLTVSVYEV